MPTGTFQPSRAVSWGVKDAMGLWLACCVSVEYAQQLVRETPGARLVADMNPWSALGDVEEQHPSTGPNPDLVKTREGEAVEEVSPASNGEPEQTAGLVPAA